MTTRQQQQQQQLDRVAQDLAQAAARRDVYDVTLVGCDDDDVPVPASRFVLAARSPVLRRMLYGPFQEAKTNSVRLLAYSSAILQAVVEFCSCGGVDEFLQTQRSLHNKEASVRQWVQLELAADYFELPELQDLAEHRTRILMTQYPALACAVFDEAILESDLSNCAWQIMALRPYVALDRGNSNDDDNNIGGGLECMLKGDRVLELARNPHIAAGELFLFQMLLRWFQAAPASRKTVARECMLHIQLENIEPRELLAASIQSCPFVNKERIFTAVAKQALLASQNRIWTMQCRGRLETTCERVLVEGAGVRDANGLYYRIPGLTTGDLYTKREVACGQQHVYTLSCCRRGDDVLECRIFQSQLLSHGAVPRLVRSAAVSETPTTIVLGPTVQPVLQVLDVEQPSVSDKLSRASTSRDSRKLYCLTLSDGDYYMSATLSNSLAPLLETGEISKHSIVQVLEFRLHQPVDESCYVHITKVSVIMASPGNQFGNPVPGHEAKVDFSSFRAVDFQDDDTDGARLRNLYSCSYPSLSSMSFNTKIPRTGWDIDEHGCSPSPSCTWIPATRASSSTNSSMRSDSSFRSSGRLLHRSAAFRLNKSTTTSPQVTS